MSASPEQISQKPSLDLLLRELEVSTPKIVDPFRPSNNEEQKRRFLAGEIKQPVYRYELLEEYDFDSARDRLESLTLHLREHPESNPKYDTAYQEAISENLSKLRILEVAHLLHGDITDDERDALYAEYMRHNIDVYGEPDNEVHNALVGEAYGLVSTADIAVTDVANELAALLPEYDTESRERFRPSEETVEWVKAVAENLYGDLLAHVDVEKSEYSAVELRDLFEQIIQQEFGESAADWKVVLGKASSIEVQRIDKKIIIPEDKKPVSAEATKGLVAHEIGVHFLRTLMGSETDMRLMQFGFKGYYDIEEGIGMVMQQATTTGYKEGAGAAMYLAASLAYFEHKSFEEVFEIMWRRSLLEKHKPGTELTDDAIEAARSLGYNQARRIFRGSDVLPLFKDLNYLTGTEIAWKYFDSIRGDDQQLTLALMGKHNPTSPAHMRTVLETKSV